MSDPMNYWDGLVGTRWRGASGGVWTVERIEGDVAIGEWDSGGPWLALKDEIPKLYTPVPLTEEPLP